jgi:hypothetical protein
MFWSYFGFERGKGVHDGAKTILKQGIKKEHLNMDPRKPQNGVECGIILSKVVNGKTWYEP